MAIQAATNYTLPNKTTNGYNSSDYDGVILSIENRILILYVLELLFFLYYIILYYDDAYYNFIWLSYNTATINFKSNSKAYHYHSILVV